MELYGVLAYQLVYTVLSLVQTKIMFVKRWEEHRMTMYYVFGQISVIRMSIPLLDFENRKTFMSNIEMISFLICQLMYLLIMLIAGVYLKFNIYIILINSLVICVIILPIGVFRMFSEEGEEALDEMVKHIELIINIFILFTSFFAFMKLSNDSDIY